MSTVIELLKEQIEKIEEIRHPPAYHPQYMIWENTTKRLLQQYFNKEYVDMFMNAGPGKVAAGTEEHNLFFLQRIDDQKKLLEGFIEEKQRFEDDRELKISKKFPLKSYTFHEEIEKVSNELFKNEHYAQAVEEAFKRVIKEVKRIVKEVVGEEIDGDRLMNRAFGIENQKPVILFNKLKTSAEKDEQKGMMFLFKGIVCIRNRKAHDNVLLGNPERAVEYLALASLLMRLLDEFGS
jgi:uncharacterized protein (TIGR02391 family)